MPIALTKVGKGGYGLRALVTIPRIASGAGSLARFDLTFRKRVSDHRAAPGTATCSARCSDGNFVFEPEVEFADGNIARGLLAEGCNPARQLAAGQPGVEPFAVGPLEVLAQHLLAGAVGGGGDQAPHQLGVDPVGPFGAALGGADQVAEPHVGVAARVLAAPRR